MKSWYTTRESVNLQHKSQPIAKGKRIFLTEAQAALHGEKVEKSEAPKTANEAGVKAEYDEWQQSQSVKPTDKPNQKAEGRRQKAEG